MFDRGPIVDILLENCTTLAERRTVLSLTEAEMDKVNNTMVDKLFQSAIDKAHVDFDDIPNSKGDITKYDGYKSMVETLNILRTLATKSQHKIPELDIIEKAINNIVGFRDVFERGFKLNKDFIILQYNTLVAACVIATSSVISSYVDYIKTVDRIDFVIINSKHTPGKVAIDNLSSFNRSVSSGEFAKVTNGVITADSQKFTGTFVVTTAIIIGAAIFCVVFMRDIVFYIYYSRVKISEYLRTQALFLELNKNVINSQGYEMSATKKQKVISNQAKLIDQLNDLADKIDVSDKFATNNMKTEIKKENSGWKIDDVKSQATSSDPNGFQLI